MNEASISLKNRLAQYVGVPSMAARLLKVASRGRARSTVSNEEFRSLKHLHRLTNGLATDVFNRLTSTPVAERDLERMVKAEDGARGVETMHSALRSLRENAYFKFPQLVSPGVVAELRHYAETTPARLMPEPPNGPATAVYDRQNPLTDKYAIDDAAFYAFPRAQSLSRSALLRAIAQAYLGRAPILSTLQMWWSPKFAEKPSSVAAQLYHYDFSHPKFVKFFIYLTDVTPQTGPHCLIPGTHGRDEAGKLLRSPHLNRITDEDIERAYPGKGLELCGPAGTVLAVDTRCWHKGKLPQVGDRLIMEIYFTSHAVGQALPPPHEAVFGAADAAQLDGGREPTPFPWSA